MFNGTHLRFPQAYVRLSALGGRALVQQGKLDKANEYFLRALTMCQQTPESKYWAWEEGKVLHQLGDLRERQHDYKEAKDYFEKSIEIFTAHHVDPAAIALVKKELQRVNSQKH